MILNLTPLQIFTGSICSYCQSDERFKIIKGKVVKINEEMEKTPKQTKKNNTKTTHHLHSGVEILQGILLKDENSVVILKNVLAFRRDYFSMQVNLLFLSASKEAFPSVAFSCAHCLKLVLFFLDKVRLAMIILIFVLHT